MLKEFDNNNIYILIIDIFFISLLIFFYIFAILFLRSTIYKENIKNSYHFYPFLSYQNHLLNFISPKIKTIAIIKLFLVEILASFLSLSLWFVLILLWSQNNISFYWPHFLVFTMIAFIDLIIILATIIYILKKKFILETDNKTLIEEFNGFIENWIKEKPLQKIYFKFEFESKIKNNLYNNKYNYFIYHSLNNIKQKKSEEIVFHTIYQFRNYLTSVRRDFNELLENLTSINGLPKNDQNFSKELKYALVNNFIFAYTYS